MSKRVWNLMYVVGNPTIFTNVTPNADNPLLRAEALAGAERIGANGWRVWVEHIYSKKRIFESEQERTFIEAERQ